MSLKTELQLVSTENLTALLASDTIGTFERETNHPGSERAAEAD